jgi:spermidine/putrescine transport system substrate-binding protein
VAERDLDAMLRRMSQTKVNRRSFLGAAGLTGAAAALAACSGSTTSAAPSAAAPSAAASAGASAAPVASASAAAAGPLEKELLMYNWSLYIDPDNIEAFKAEFGVDTFQYDVYGNNEELLAKLKGGAGGYDIASPTAEYIPGMVEEGFIQKLDVSRIPNLKYINEKFQKLWWDPTDEYHVPKDFGTTGILYRGKTVPNPPQSWADFYTYIKGEGSGKTVFVDSMGDVMVFPLKMKGYSLNSVDQKELEEARQVLLDVAPHILALDSDKYGDKLASEEATVALGWTGPLFQVLATEETKDAGYVVPSEGSLFWLDTWVMLADAPHPNISYAWLDYIHRPEVQAKETNYNGYGTPSDAAKPLVDPAVLANPAVFPPDDIFAKLQGAEDTSGNNQRLDIWEEFKQKIGG